MKISKDYTSFNVQSQYKKNKIKKCILLHGKFKIQWNIFKDKILLCILYLETLTHYELLMWKFNDME